MRAALFYGPLIISGKDPVTDAGFGSRLLTAHAIWMTRSEFGLIRPKFLWDSSIAGEPLEH